MSELAPVRLEGRTGIITINRPEKRNALSRALIQALDDAFRSAAANPQIRSVILTGNGSAFCAGMDLEELRGTIEKSEESELVWTDAHRLSALYELIYTFPKPTLAAVNGAAVAGGAGLTTVCDLAIAVPQAKFGYPEVLRGLVAAMVLPHLLRHVGERAARWMLLTGQLISATEALQLSLINRVVQSAELFPTALQIAESFAQGGPKALNKTKELLQRCSRQAVSVEELAQASAEPRLTDECRGGLTAFFENRPAPWMSGG